MVRREVKEGDLVLIRDKAAHRNDWPLGRIISICLSHDGKVRRVTVKVCKGDFVKTYVRPIHELILIMGEEEM